MPKQAAVWRGADATGQGLVGGRTSDWRAALVVVPAVFAIGKRIEGKLADVNTGTIGGVFRTIWVLWVSVWASGHGRLPRQEDHAEALVAAPAKHAAPDQLGADHDAADVVKISAAVDV